MYRRLLEATLSPAVAGLIACICLWGLGRHPWSAAVAIATGAIILAATLRWMHQARALAERLGQLRRALGVMAGESLQLGALPEGEDELAEMGRVFREGYQRLQSARVEAARLSDRAELDARLAGALAAFATSVAGVADPAAVWPPLGDALQAGLGAAAWHRVLLRDVETGVLTPAAEGGSAAEDSTVAEFGMTAGGDLVGVLQVSADSTGGPVQAFLGSLASHAVLAWTNAVHMRTVEDAANTDGLTGLYNRRWLDQYLVQEVERSKRSGRPFSLAMIDADHFKQVNDRWGHAAGDKALRAIAECVRGVGRAADVVARYGGEEIVLVLPETPAAGAVRLAERVRAAVRALQVEHRGVRIPLTVSVGCATWPEHGEDLERVCAAAEAAVYRAKEAGRNRVVRADKMEGGLPAEATSMQPVP